MKATTKEVADYLNHLTVVKRSAEQPVSVEKSDEIFLLKDKNGIPFLMCDKAIYDIYQEL